MNTFFTSLALLGTQAVQVKVQDYSTDFICQHMIWFLTDPEFIHDRVCEELEACRYDLAEARTGDYRDSNQIEDCEA